MLQISVSLVMLRHVSFSSKSKKSQEALVADELRLLTWLGSSGHP
jgi:hypothetical protein